MNKDYQLMEKTLAKMLRVEPSNIESWRVDSGAQNRGIIQNRMDVRVQAEKRPERLMLCDENLGSFRVMSERTTPFGLYWEVEYSIILLRGKETAEVFAALAYLMALDE